MTEVLNTAQKLIDQGFLKPEGVSYESNKFMLRTVEGLPMSTSHSYIVDRPRLVFARVLALFKEPAQSETVIFEPLALHPSEYPKLGRNTVLGGPGFGYEPDEDGIPFRIRHLGKVRIGKHVEIGSNTCIDRGTISDTVIGDYVKIDNLVHIAHNAKIGNKTCIAAGAVICGSVEIGESCFIGVNASIKQKVKVGNNCTIGMGAIVLADVPDNTTVKGVWKGDKL